MNLNMKTLDRFFPMLLAASVVSLFLGSVAHAQGDGKLVIEAGRIITMAGDDIENGVIVIDNGRITAIGPADQVEKPWDAPVVGGSEFTAFPGFVEAHTSSGMDRPNENFEVAPFLDIRDSVDPVSYYFEDCLRWGITTINIQQGPFCVVGARGMIVRPVGMTVEEMMVQPQFGLKVSTVPKRGKSRSTQMQSLRNAFDDLRRYLERLVEKERDERGHAKREALFQGRDMEGEKNKGRAMSGSAWKVEGLEIIPRGAIDEKYEPLLELVEGRYPVFFQCSSPMEVSHAIDVAKGNGFLERTTLVLDEDCWKAADVIAEAGVSVILDGDLVHQRRDPLTGEELETFVPQVFEDKGITYALSSENWSDRSLWYQAAVATGLGLSREKALASVTTQPAAILGMSDQLGTLEVGKFGNVCLFTGDPLSVTTWVDKVVIEGRAVYDRADDVRNRHLLEGITPQGTAPPAMGEGEEEGNDEHGDDEHGDDEHGDDEHGDDEHEGEEDKD